MTIIPEVYSYSIFLAVGSNMLVAAISIYHNIREYREKKARKMPYVLRY